MKIFSVSVFIGLVFLLSCHNQSKEPLECVKLTETDKINIVDTFKSTADNSNPFEDILATIPADTHSVFGYRFEISGDFDGDGKKEHLLEHYFSSIDNKETNKYYKGLNEYNQLVVLTQLKEPYSFVMSDNLKIDTLHIAKNNQLFGLSYLKNEGDLNGDGTDEVSYVVDWADWSNSNTWHIVTFEENEWKELYAFPIWDWQIPDLPELINQYGLLGLEDKIVFDNNDSINRVLINKLKEFKGLVKKVNTNKIQIIYRNNEAMEDTMIVDLTKLK